MFARAWFMVALCLVTTPAVADGLGSDIAAVRGKDWFVRATFVGWSEGQAVFRQTTCDPDALGGDVPTCSIRLCVASATPDRAAWPNCPFDGWSLELPEDPARRATVDPAVVRSTYDRALAGVTLAKGVSLPRSMFATTITRESPSKGRVVITPKLGGFAPFVGFQHDASDEGREQRIESVTITDATRSVDRRCIAVAGFIVFDTFYESVRGTIRVPFASTQCRR